MSACNPFDVTFKGSAQNLVDKARKRVEEAGGTFHGDTKGGSFEVPTWLGKVKGVYKINGQVLTVTITEKPGVYLCALIEKIVRDEIAKATGDLEAVAGCPEFCATHQGTAQQFLDAARKAIEEAGGKLVGDTREGTFELPSPPIAGRYRFAPDRQVCITVTVKPLFVPCWLIEAAIRWWIENVAIPGRD